MRSPSPLLLLALLSILSLSVAAPTPAGPPPGSDHEDLRNAVPIPLGTRPETVGQDPLAPEGSMVRIELRTGRQERFPQRESIESPEGRDSRPPHRPSDGLRLLGRDFLQRLDFARYDSTANPFVWPYSAKCKVFMYWDDHPDIVGVCSGTLISRSFVLTAAHCMLSFETERGYPDSVVVAAAYADGDMPFGYANAADMYLWDGWIDWGDYDHDVALLRLNRPMGAVAGWMGYGYDTSCNWFLGGTWHNEGYPSEDGFDGQWMQSTTGSYDDCEKVGGTWYGNEVLFDRPMPRGSSGSGNIRDNIVYTVRSNTCCVFDIDTYDTRLTQNKFDFIEQAIDVFTHDFPYVHPMNVDVPDNVVSVGGALSPWQVFLFNESTASYSGTIRLEAYLSEDDRISSFEDILLGVYEADWAFGPNGGNHVTLPGYTIPLDTPAGLYYVGVIAETIDGTPVASNLTHPSDLDWVSVNCGTITQIIQQSPASGSDCESSSVLLQWQPQPWVDGYHVQVGTACGVGNIYYTTDPWLTVSGLDPGELYFWHVRATGTCGSSPVSVPYSSCWTFRVQGDPPAAPTLVSPAAGATCVDNQVARLDWETDPDVVAWKIQIGTACGIGTYYGTTTGESLYDVAGLAHDTTYYWRVQGTDGCGQWGPWSACRSFTTSPESAGLYVPLVSPVDDAECLSTTSLTLDWDPVAGVTEYEVWLGTSGCYYIADPDSVWTTTATQAVLSGLTPNTKYFWTINAYDDCGRRINCVCWDFETEGPGPAAPLHLEPGEDVTCTPNDVQLTWDASPGATRYAVEFREELGTIDTWTTMFTYANLSGLRRGTHSWRVRSINGCAADGPWSPLVSFTIDTTDPPLPTGLQSTSHATRTYHNLNRIALEWLPAADDCGMGGYSLAVDPDRHFLPDETVETEQTSWQTEELGDGTTHYVHLRAVDQAGNPSVDAVHLGPFYIDATPPQVQVVIPNGGEIWTPGSTRTITWTASDNIGLAGFELAYRIGKVAPWIPITSVNPGDRTYDWTTPSDPASGLKIRVQATDLAGNAVLDETDGTFRLSTAGGIGDGVAGERLILHPAYPNPFSGRTTVTFEAAAEGVARVTILDARGRLVRPLLETFVPAGTRREIRWDGRDDGGRLVGSGVYYCRLELHGETRVQRLLFLRR